MLVLAPESCCDVCAESYGQDSAPHAIPCGHTFCAPCLTEIAKRGGGQRGAGCCPLCREPFSGGDVRGIRIDQGVSSSPPYPQIQPYPNYYPAPNSSSASSRGYGFGSAPLDEDALDDSVPEEDEERRLEARVLDATKRGNSFEDLSGLKREIEQCVSKRPGREHTALKISAALLQAILVNGFHHNEVKKTAKVAEDSKRKLELEVYRLKLEVSKLTGAPPPLPPPTATTTTPAPTPAAVPARAPAPAPAPAPPRAFGSSLAPMPMPKPSPLASSHMRSQTPGPMPSSQRPAAPTHRTMTPGPTPTHAHRSMTPGPAPALHRTPTTPTHRAMTPGPGPSPSSASSRSYAPTTASPFARASATTSHLPVGGAPAAAVSERHRVWMPSSREDDEGGGGGGKRPGTAAGHHRSFSLGLGFGSSRPRTANGHR